jgi:hypothetical protein
MNIELNTALKKLGYREMTKGIFGKTVAFHLLYVDTTADKPEMINWFVGAGDGKIAIWNKQSLELVQGSNYLDLIKSCECYTRFDVGLPQCPSKFEFLTSQQFLEEVL